MGRPSRLRPLDAVIREMAARGRTFEEIAIAIRASGRGVGLYCRANHIERRMPDRETAMRALVAAGKTRAEIAAAMGLGYDNARRLLRIHRLTVPAAPRKPKQKAQIDVGEGLRRAMLCAYTKQKHNAKRRGVEWRITFEEWRSVWNASGRWAERGRRVGQYVMARRGDVGPYDAANVLIQTAAWNCSDRWRNKENHPSKVLPKQPNCTEEMPETLRHTEERRTGGIDGPRTRGVPRG